MYLNFNSIPFLYFDLKIVFQTWNLSL